MIELLPYLANYDNYLNNNDDKNEMMMIMMFSFRRLYRNQENARYFDILKQLQCTASIEAELRIGIKNRATDIDCRAIYVCVCLFGQKDKFFYSRRSMLVTDIYVLQQN